jgi:hypothetical protein
MWYFGQAHHQIYGHIRCIYTVLVKLYTTHTFCRDTAQHVQVVCHAVSRCAVSRCAVTPSVDVLSLILRSDSNLI